MSDYTPTTDEIAEWYAHKGGSTMAPYYGSKLTKRMNEFDRWLAAHDAEVRAAALAEQDTEERDWEYGAGYRVDNGQGMHWFSMDSHGFVVREAAERQVENYSDAQIKLIRRRKAGPWMPVEQEGETDG